MTTTPTKNESLPAGFGAMCTVAWTELVAAMREDGHTVADKSGPKTREWIVRMVEDTCKAAALTREAPTEGVDWLDRLVEVVGRAESKQTGAAAMYLARMAHESNAGELDFTMRGVSRSGDEFGDWQIIVREATPPAPQRLAQGECRHSLWSPAGGYCLDCGYSPVGPDEESAIDAAVGLTKVVLRLPVDLLGEIDHRAQQSGCVRNAYLRQLLAEHHSQPPHQDRVEVNQRLRDAIEGECDGLGITEKSADAILRYIGFHPAGRIVGGSDIDGVWVIEATGHSGLMPNQLLVRYDDYLRDVNSKYRCDDCGGDGRQCLAGRSAHRSNWYACETCNGAGTIAALTEAKQQDNRALAESVFNIPVPARGFHEGWRDEEIWQWALRAAAAHILGTTQSEAEKLLTTSSTGEPEAKQQGPGEAVDLEQFREAVTVYREWCLESNWPAVKEADQLLALIASAPQVEAKRQTGEVDLSRIRFHDDKGAFGTLERLTRYAQQRDMRHTLLGQTMEEAAAIIHAVIAAAAKPSWE